MEKKQEVDINIKIDLANLPDNANGQVENAKEKIMTSLSVSQVAYLIRLLHDAEIIVFQNKSNVLARIAHCLVTRNASEISIKSLKAKYYTVDPATKASVKSLLLQLLNALE